MDNNENVTFNSNEYDFSDIFPIDFNLERQFINEIDNFLTNTKDLTLDWKKRNFFKKIRWNSIRKSRT